MSITKKQQRIIDEYLVDLNAQKTGVRVGFAPKYARQTVYKNLQKPEVKAELAKRMKASRMTADEVIKRLEAMTMGDAPTKTIIVDGKVVKEEYDVITATDKMGKIYALFVDKQIVENIGLEIIDDDEEDG